MISARFARTFTVAILALVVGLQALPASARGATATTATATVTSAATSTTTAVTSSTTPRLYCGPLLDKVCQVICRNHCGIDAAVATPRATTAATAPRVASPRFTCVQELQTVCSIVFFIPCHFHGCYGDVGTSSPAGVTSWTKFA